MRKTIKGKIWEGGDVVLLIQAHPDDAEYSVGGTIAKMVDDGCTINYVTVTDGSKGTYDLNADPKELSELRKREQRAAADVLGVKELFFLGYPDGDLYASLELRGKLVEVIRVTKPDIVMALDAWLPYEIHPDHRVTGMMASEAAVFAGMPNFYREQILSGMKPHRPDKVLLFSTANPNVYVDITKFIKHKVEAIVKHESQLSLVFPGGAEEAKAKLERIIKRRNRRGSRYVESMRMFKVAAGHFARE